MISVVPGLGNENTTNIIYLIATRRSKLLYQFANETFVRNSYFNHLKPMKVYRKYINRESKHFMRIFH